MTLGVFCAGPGTGLDDLDWVPANSRYSMIWWSLYSFNACCRERCPVFVLICYTSALEYFFYAFQNHSRVISFSFICRWIQEHLHLTPAEHWCHGSYVNFYFGFIKMERERSERKLRELFTLGFSIIHLSTKFNTTGHAYCSLNLGFSER